MARDHGDWVVSDVGAAGVEAIIRGRITGTIHFLERHRCHATFQLGKSTLYHSDAASRLRRTWKMAGHASVCTTGRV